MFYCTLFQKYVATNYLAARKSTQLIGDNYSFFTHKVLHTYFQSFLYSALIMCDLFDYCSTILLFLYQIFEQYQIYMNINKLNCDRNYVVFSFSPSDTKFVTCSDDGTLRIWDFFRYQEERVLRGKYSLFAICFKMYTLY